MDGAEKYRRDLDIIFQELEEKEQLQRQAQMQPYAEFIVELLRHKNIQALVKSMPQEDQIKFIDTCWQARQAQQKKNSANHF